MPYKSLKIYGSNTDLGATPTKIAVEALADLVDYDLPVVIINGQPAIEYAEHRSLSGRNWQTMGKNKWSCSLETSRVMLNDITSFADFYLTDLIPMKFKYLDLSDYELKPDSVTTGKVLRVMITRFTPVHEPEAGWKYLKLELEEDA